MSEPMEANPDLVIGWAVTKGLDPQYWLAPQSSAGGHSLNDLVRVPAASMANHMVIVAQSGSGKSFFLGRVVEEIVIKTKSRVFIFDPNSDFRKIDQIVSADLWKERARYDAIQRRGFLPDEETRENFENKWKKVDKLVFSVRPDDSNTHKKLQIDWFGVSVDFLAEDVDPTLQNELRHCHDFVKSIAQLVAFTKSQAAAGKEDILDLSRRLCEETRGKTRNDIVFVLKDRLPLPDELVSEKLELSQWTSIFLNTSLFLLKGARAQRDAAESLYQKAAVSRSFVLEQAERFYFSIAYAVRESGLLRQTKIDSPDPTNARLQVVDLPSVTEPRFRLLAVSTLLQTEWARARQSWETALAGPPKEDERVPTFIVVDEAHNLIPAEARNHSELRLREQFRTVAAEGRKFGLFLILVSQRPDKLDPLVLSECENRAIMRLGSDAVLKKTTEGLGLGDVPLRMRERCLEFDVGRALIFGSWSPEATFLYSAARRTEEGGRNLRADYWAQPPADTVDLPPTASAKQNAGARKSVATAQPKKRKPRAGARKLKPT